MNVPGKSNNQPPVARTIRCDGSAPESEWIVTNGLGGYASGTISGALARKYHGLLIAALPAPLGRVVMWNHLAESLCFGDGETILLGQGAPNGLREFRLEDGLPVWIYDVRGVSIEKRVVVPRGQNTVLVRYRLADKSERARLQLRPAFNFCRHDESVAEKLAMPYAVRALDGRYEISCSRANFPSLRMRLSGSVGDFTSAPSTIRNVQYRTELERGYEDIGNLWSPGFFQVEVDRENPATLMASTEIWQAIDALTPENVIAAEGDRRAHLLAADAPETGEGIVAELIYASDQFIIRPARGNHGIGLTSAASDDARTVIAGYHWFTDWGRDTMISLEGLTLATGRHAEAGEILRTFAKYVRDGLIPNLFPDGADEGLYHTADATLWFFHALGRYLEQANDRSSLPLLLPTLIDIAEHHLRGTKFGIHVDPADGLLVQGADGYQLTWMDAKMDDWVVTPRRGKAVEINALWYNALKLLEGWLRQTGDSLGATGYAEHAARARSSFNERFWFAEGGHLYDVIDTPDGIDDSACRPNQIFAIALDHPALEPARWASVLNVVERELLTPFGLRSLSPKHPDYEGRYEGDLRSRDGAYHQGTVWGWLIGPFIDAWLRVHPDEPEAAWKFLAQFPKHLRDAGLGTISEVFDGDEPHQPRGCIAQAWSVAEVLRSCRKIAASVREVAA